MTTSNNPYVKRIHDFPGQIFCFNDFEDDRNHLRKLATAAQHVFCEIGSGSGKHLITLGASHPQNIYFGLEIRFKRAVRTVEKSNKQGVKNIHVLHINANEIGRLFFAQSLDGVYIHFPDPWEKRRQQKHRLLSRRFFEILCPLLKPGSFVSVKTDHHHYFADFLKDMQQLPQFDIIESTNNLYTSEFLATNIQSEFESLFVSQHLPICYARLVKCEPRMNANAEELTRINANEREWTLMGKV